jgi:hypothetical protein
VKPQMIDLGAFAETQKVTISFVVSVRPSFLPSVRMEQLGTRWTDFHENLTFKYLLKACRENSSFFKI